MVFDLIQRNRAVARPVAEIVLWSGRIDAIGLAQPEDPVQASGTSGSPGGYPAVSSPFR